MKFFKIWTMLPIILLLILTSSLSMGEERISLSVDYKLTTFRMPLAEFSFKAPEIKGVYRFGKGYKLSLTYFSGEDSVIVSGSTFNLNYKSLTADITMPVKGVDLGISYREFSLISRYSTLNDSDTWSSIGLKLSSNWSFKNRTKIDLSLEYYPSFTSKTSPINYSSLRYRIAYHYDLPEPTNLYLSVFYEGETLSSKTQGAGDIRSDSVGFGLGLAF